MAHFEMQKCPKMLKEIAEKRNTAVFSQADQRANRLFSVFKSVNSVSKSDDTLTARRRRAVKVSFNAPK